MVGNDVDLCQSILQWLHSSPVGGHSGINANMLRVKSILYWKGMTKDIKTFVNHCGICQRLKHEIMTSTSLLQHFPNPG